MKEALIVLARDRVFGFGQIEDDAAIFDNDRAATLAQEIFERPAHLFRGHGLKSSTSQPDCL